jgi:ABC-2 type transport system permease protein
MRTRFITIVLVAIITVLAVHVVTRWTEAVRVDVTEDRLYSLTDGTAQILDRMQRENVPPVDVTLYFSETAGKSLPSFIKQFVVYQDYLRALLGEYERASGGRIKVHFVDPKPDSDEAQDALDDGLDGKPINQHGDLFFFGLVLETRTGSKDVIEFLWPDHQEDVEYEISRRLYELLWPSSQRIGVLSSLDVLPSSDPYMAQLLAAQGKQPPAPWVAMQVLDERYDITTVDPDTDHIDDDLDLLVVIHPRDLSTRALWAVDEWVATGGNTLVFIDPFSLNDQPPTNPRDPFAGMQYTPASSLNRITGAWGVTMSDGQIAADPALATRRQVNRRGAVEPVIVDLSIDQQTREGTVNNDNPITRGLERLRLFMAGSLEIEPRDGITVTPLLTTTPTGNTLAMKAGFPGAGDGLVYMDANNPAKLIDAFTAGDHPVVLAALVQGRLPSAFPDGASFPSEPVQRPPGLPAGIEPPVPDDAEMTTVEPVPDELRADATVLIVADTDLIADQLAFQNSLLGTVAANDNHKLLLNAVDYLLGARELMSVRAKSSIQRPFERFDEIEAAAEAETRERERSLREEIASFQEEIRNKQGELGRRNAALFQKKLQDEVDQINARLRDAERELRDIRKARRAALESEERWVRFSIMGLMPMLVLIAGIVLAVRRSRRRAGGQGGQA